MCHTKLDSVRSAIGKNGDAYCSGCYKQQLEMERARTNMAKPMHVIAADPGDKTACPRCNGKVFEAEKIVAGDNVWFHKVNRKQQLYYFRPHQTLFFRPALIVKCATPSLTA